jgi:hypothetical protein
MTSPLEPTVSGIPSLISNFKRSDFQIEIFFQPLPVTEQWSYQHLAVEHKLLQKHGDQLRQQVLMLKQSGYSTEAAFCKALNISGDPYISILNLEAELN